jgi:hypothetical protein
VKHIRRNRLAAVFEEICTLVAKDLHYILTHLILLSDMLPERGPICWIRQRLMPKCRAGVNLCRGGWDFNVSIVLPRQLS